MRMFSRTLCLLRRFASERSGASMVEFAIVAPLLFIILFGIADFGRLFFEYNSLTNAARDAARTAAVTNGIVPSAEATKDRVMALVNNARVTRAMVSVDSLGAPPAVTVRVSITGVPFVQVTPFVQIVDVLPTVRAEFRYEFQ